MVWLALSILGSIALIPVVMRPRWVLRCMRSLESASQGVITEAVNRGQANDQRVQWISRYLLALAYAAPIASIGAQGMRLDHGGLLIPGEDVVSRSSLEALEDLRADLAWALPYFAVGLGAALFLAWMAKPANVKLLPMGALGWFMLSQQDSSGALRFSPTGEGFDQSVKVARGLVFNS